MIHAQDKETDAYNNRDSSLKRDLISFSVAPCMNEQPKRVDTLSQTYRADFKDLERIVDLVF
jgi:hypothetical protein